MIQAYLLSIFVWMAIILYTIHTTKSKIAQNGWLDDAEPSEFSQWIVSLLLISMTPILRLMTCWGMYYMSIETKEHFEEKYKNEDDE